MVSCGALGAVVANRAPQRLPYLAVAQLVPVGMVVSASDLESVSITPATGLGAIPTRDAGEVVGRRAAEPLEPGSLLVPSELASAPALPAGSALVGTSLADNQMPAELATGQHVLVVLSGTTGSGTTGSGSSSGAAPASTSTMGDPGRNLQGASGVSTPSQPDQSATAVPSPTGPPGSVLTAAIVVSISASGGSSAAGVADSPADIVTLEVPEGAAASVTAASAAGNVSLAVLGGPDGAG